MVKRTLSHEVRTVWPKVGMRSKESFERLWLRPDFHVPTAPAPVPIPGEIVRWPRLRLIVLGFCALLQGFGAYPRPDSD